MAIEFFDDFVDSIATPLTSHIPDIGTGWIDELTIQSPIVTAPQNFQMQISGPVSNFARPNKSLFQGLHVSLAIDTPSSPDYQVTSFITNADSDRGSNFFLVARYLDEKNFYAAGGYNLFSSGNGDRGLVLFVMHEGFLTILDADPGIGVNDLDELRFVCTDETKELFVNGNLVLRATGNPLRNNAGRAGFTFGNWLDRNDDVRVQWGIGSFEVDTTIGLEPEKPEIEPVRIRAVSDSQIQLFAWRGLNSTNRGKPIALPRLTRKSVQAVGLFTDGVVRMEGSTIPDTGDEIFAGQYVQLLDELGDPVRFQTNTVIDRVNHAYAYRPVMLSGTAENVTVYILSVED